MVGILDTPISSLFAANSHRAHKVVDRVLQDDLGMAGQIVNDGFFGSEEERFAFQRCESRLAEMQSAKVELC